MGLQTEGDQRQGEDGICRKGERTPDERGEDHVDALLYTEEEIALVLLGDGGHVAVRSGEVAPLPITPPILKDIRVSLIHRLCTSLHKSFC